MWNSLRSLAGQRLGTTATPLPSPVTITGIRFPADGSKPHLLPLTTTTHGMSDSMGSRWGHLPDLRAFWKTDRAWQRRDTHILWLEGQPLDCCNGLYVVFFCFDLDLLPENGNLPKEFHRIPATPVGDVFVVKLKENDNGSELGEDGWAAWDDVPADILSLPVMRM